MREIVYTPLTRIEHKGENFILLERSIDGYKGRIYSINRVVEDEGVPSDGVKISAKEITRIEVPELAGVYKETKDKMAGRGLKQDPRIQYLLAELYKVRPDLHMTSYVYIGVADFGNVNSIFSSAVLARMYLQGLRASRFNNQTRLTSLDELYELDSIQLLFKVMTFVGMDIDAFKENLAKTKYEWSEHATPGKNVGQEVLDLFKRKGIISPRVKLTYFPESGNVHAVYSDRLGAVNSYALSRRYFKGESWKGISDIMADKEDPFYPIFMGIIGSMPDRDIPKQ